MFHSVRPTLQFGEKNCPNCTNKKSYLAAMSSLNMNLKSRYLIHHKNKELCVKFGKKKQCLSKYNRMVFSNIAKVGYTFSGSLQHTILVSKFFDRPAKLNKIKNSSKKIYMHKSTLNLSCLLFNNCNQQS